MAGPMFIVDFEPHYGEMVDVSPLLRRMVCRNPSKFTFHGTGTYVIGRGDVAVVDPGPRDEQHVEALLRALDGERVRHVADAAPRRDTRAVVGATRRSPSDERRTTRDA